MKKHQIILAVILVGVAIMLFLNSGIFSDTESDNNGTAGQHSLSEMSVEIKRSIQTEFDKDDYYSDYGIKVQKVNLIETGKNSYKAYVDIKYLNGKDQTISADVHISNDQYFWEFPAGSFLLLLDENDELDYDVLEKYQRPTEKELLQMLKEGNFDEASRWLTIDEIFQRAMLLDIADGIPEQSKEQKHTDNLSADEEGSSDRNYYATIEDLRNDKDAFTFTKPVSNSRIVGISSEIETIQIAYPAVKSNSQWLEMKVFVLEDGTVASATIEGCHYNADEEYKASCISAALNTTFRPGTPNIVRVMYWGIY